MSVEIRRIKRVQEMTGLSRVTIYRRIQEGSFPRPLKLGANSVGWRESDVLDFINSLQVTEPREVAPGSKKGRKPRASAVAGG